MSAGPTDLAPNGRVTLPRAATLDAAVVVGSPRPRSRTLAVATSLTAAIRSGLQAAGVAIGQPDLIDLSQLMPLLGAHIPGTEPGPAPAGDPVARALARTRAPQVLVVVSPTLKGSYAGLLKVFLELLPRDGLAGTVAVPAMIAARTDHRFAVDLHLRALLVELGACVPTRGLSVLERDIDRLDTALVGWLSENLPVLSAVLAGSPAQRK